LSPRQTLDAQEALTILAPQHLTLEAAKYYIRHAQPANGNKTVSEVVEELLACKQRAGKSIDNLRASMQVSQIRKDFGTPPFRV
jgi:hypothetical protein